MEEILRLMNQHNFYYLQSISLFHNKNYFMKINKSIEFKKLIKALKRIKGGKMFSLFF